MNKQRFKNPWFWLGILGIIFTSIGVSAETLTSWEIVKNSLIQFFNYPYQLGCAVVAIIGVFIDPTTKGLSDKK